MVVAPDFGGAVRARRFAKLLGENIPVGIIEKERQHGAGTIMHNFVGEDPRGKFIILFDDMIDTAGSIVTSIRALRNRGVGKIQV